MKYVASLVLCLLLPMALYAQRCEQHHLQGDCLFDFEKGYETYSQSHSAEMSPLDTIDFNVVFYGQNDYIISFCTHRKMYPVHFQLIDEQSGDLLYDNEDDNYLEILGLGFDVAKSVTIRVDVLARKSNEQEIKENVGCLGMLIQYQKYEEKSVKLDL